MHILGNRTENKTLKQSPSGQEVLCMDFVGVDVSPCGQGWVWNKGQHKWKFHSPWWELLSGKVVQHLRSSSQTLILGHFFFFFNLFLASVLARTHIIKSLSFPCESLIEQAVTLPCHKIFFHLRTQKNLLWTWELDTLSSFQQSQKLSKRRREPEGGGEKGVAPHS